MLNATVNKRELGTTKSRDSGSEPVARYTNVDLSGVCEETGLRHLEVRVLDDA
jgi:hypothetical protein